MEKTQTQKTSTDIKSIMAQMTQFFEDLFLKKAPALPVRAKEVIVKYAPYMTIFILILAIPGVLALMGIRAALLPLAGVAGTGVMLTSLFLIASLVMEGLSIPGLMARKVAGWNWVYWGVLVNIVYNLLTLNIIGGIISAAISLWVLFQIKEYYK